MEKKTIIVIGAGASGMMAAGKAAEMGADVLVLEKTNKPGKKLMITGKGRCNITNTVPIREFIPHFGKNGKFLRQALHRFTNTDLVNFFESLGLKTNEERGGRVFPASNSAKDVVDVLKRWTFVQKGVILRTGSYVDELVLENGEIKGVRLKNRDDSNDKKKLFFPAKAVIVAVGGASYPVTGSTGDGFELARQAGHTIIPVRQSLVPFEIGAGIGKKLDGLTVKNVTASVWIRGKKESEEFGDLEFRSGFLAGPIILSQSLLMVDALNKKDRVEVHIDLKPALDHQKLDARLLRELTKNSKKEFLNVLRSLLPSAMIPLCLQQTGLNEDKVCHQITADERKRLRLWLKEFKIDVLKTRPFSEAIITAGGVDVGEIEPKTMQSKLVKNLYFTGEVLDIDADTGGFNLQAAFSTGWVAGASVGELTETKE